MYFLPGEGLLVKAIKNKSENKIGINTGDELVGFTKRKS